MSWPIGMAFAATLSEDGATMTLTRTADGSHVGVTDMHKASADHLRALADAVDRARGRLL